MNDWASQKDAGVRFDWGPAGSQRLAPSASCLVVVDVLSFTTAVSVLVDVGTVVYPYRWRDATAEDYAARVGAELAVPRGATTTRRPWSLSPAELHRARFTPRLVLPSPNGATIAASAPAHATIVAACLRNCSATADWLSAHGYGTTRRPVLVIAAGERWPDDTLRPALEDLLGAGALIARLRRLGRFDVSAEAAAAAASYTGVEDISAAIHDCASGRELIAHGFGPDVAIAAELDASNAVPIVRNGTFQLG